MQIKSRSRAGACIGGEAQDLPLQRCCSRIGNAVWLPRLQRWFNADEPRVRTSSGRFGRVHGAQWLVDASNGMARGYLQECYTFVLKEEFQTHRFPAETVLKECSFVLFKCE